VYRWVAQVCRELVHNPDYRNYLRFKLCRSLGRDIAPAKAAKRIPVSPALPCAMAQSIAQAAARLRHTPDDHVDNPFPILGFTVKFLSEQSFRYSFEEVFIRGSYMFSSNTSTPVIVDCGSNIGLSILFFKSIYPQARIIGFEPDPSTFSVLSENVTANQLSDVELHNIALTERDSEIQFYISPEQAGSLLMSLRRERLPGVAITVPGRRLSPFVLERVDLLKMDIEGSESIVLYELENSGALCRIDRIHLEYHHHINNMCDAMSEVLALLERNGFGYQIQSAPTAWPAAATFQDVAIFAYRDELLTRWPGCPDKA
jgi:FkbM family methyltransferase